MSRSTPQKQCPECKQFIPITFLSCDCGHAFPIVLTPPTVRKDSIGCFWVILVCVLLVFGSIIANSLSPYFRVLLPVSITLLDEAQQPVSGAEIFVHESELVLLVPPLVFASPSWSAERNYSVTTDNSGNAHFELRFERGYATSINLRSAKLIVVDSVTYDTFRGWQSQLVGQLPFWDFVGGVPKIEHKSYITISKPQ